MTDPIDPRMVAAMCTIQFAKTKGFISKENYQIVVLSLLKAHEMDLDDLDKFPDDPDIIAYCKLLDSGYSKLCTEACGQT